MDRYEEEKRRQQYYDEELKRSYYNDLGISEILRECGINDKSFNDLSLGSRIYTYFIATL